MPVYSFAVQINGVDIATYGVIVAEIPNNWDAPAMTIAEVQVPGRKGTTRTTSLRQYAPTDYIIKGNIKGTSPSDLESKRDLLGAATLGSTISLIGGNQTARQRNGICSYIKLPALYPAADAATFEMGVHCENPLAFATSTTTVTGSSGSDLACALGTEECYPVITVTSPTSPLVLTYKNNGGTTIKTLTLTLPGSSTVVVDMDNQTVTYGGTRHDEYVTAGTYFALSPLDGNYGTSAWPTVRVSSGSPSIAYTKTYR